MIAGSRVAVVGGSIGGCATAAALQRAGCQVTVFERSPGELRDRGAGLVTPVALRQQMIDAGYFPAEVPVLHSAQRLWVTADGDAPLGRVMWRQPLEVAMNHWGVLLRLLRAQVPDEAYRGGAGVTAVEPAPDGDGAWVVTGDGARRHFDAVAGADGYQSLVRRVVAAGPGPAHAGYILWRGNYPEDRIPSAELAGMLDGSFATVHYGGGHGVFYLIPGADGSVLPGQRRLNWGIYSCKRDGVPESGPGSVPQGAVDPDVAKAFGQFAEHHLPPAWRDAVGETRHEELSIQQVYEQTAQTYAAGRVFLVGDAATTSRPHSASGIVKALQDALALEVACRSAATWEEALGTYDAERRPAGNAIVEVGRRIGRATVEQTPDWSSMGAAEVEEYAAATVSGSRSFLYDND